MSYPLSSQSHNKKESDTILWYLYFSTILEDKQRKNMNRTKWKEIRILQRITGWRNMLSVTVALPLEAILYTFYQKWGT